MPSWALPDRGRLTLSEVSGSLGDLGTFIPLLLGLARQGSVHFVPAVFFAGLFNVLSGLLWDVPMCVQPMKTIAAVGIAEGLSPPQVAVAGMMVSAMVLALGLTRSIVLVGRLVPEAVVLGTQLGLGISLNQKAFALIAGSPTGASDPAQGPLDSPIARLVSAMIGVAFALAVRHSGSKVPSALILFVVGAGVGMYTLLASHAPVGLAPVPPAVWALGSLTPSDLQHALLNAALPQLPLTLLNSVVSVCKLADKLAPHARVTKPAVAVSVGLMNLLGCPFGAMPCCHGAGGLAAQHAFGARRGAAVLFLGGAKVGVAVAAGGPLLAILAAFPDSILGVLLLMSGLELARAGAQLGGKGDGAVAVGLLTAAATLKYKTGVGCLVGLGAALVCGGLGAAVRRCRERQFLFWLWHGDDESSPPLLVGGLETEGGEQAGSQTAGGGGASAAAPVAALSEGAEASGQGGAASGAAQRDQAGGERM